MLKFLRPKEPEPKELVRKWQSTLRTEQRHLDKCIRDIQMEEKKVHKFVKEAAKRGDLASAKHLAKEIVQSRKAVSRLYVNKAQMICLNQALVEQVAMVSVVGAMSKSTEVMTAVTSMIKLPELNKTMQEMSREMMKAGLIDEMMSDAMDSAMGGEDEEEEAETEVQKVLDELAIDMAASLPAAKRAQQAAAQAEPEAEADTGEMTDLQARLAAIRS